MRGILIKPEKLYLHGGTLDDKRKPLIISPKFAMYTDNLNSMS